jgi:glutamate N-acetyltransferase / amino-acid N-acetyltransferase
MAEPNPQLADDCFLATGYRYGAAHCGLRSDASRPDVALVVSDRPAAAAGVFTQNRIVAAPVKLCRLRVPTHDARGFVVCAGNANACTGRRGMEDAMTMAAEAARLAGCRPEQMLVCSTGVIGQHLPMEKVREGIRVAAANLDPSRQAFERAAHAILTTDTRMKVSTRRVRIDEQDVHLTGFAKGAAMIGPNMATMLAFVLTDAAVAPDRLTHLAGKAAVETFNCISVEGHTSTNDTLLFLANGSGPHIEGDAAARFEESAISACADLARAIAADAEGASHLIRIEIEGARTFSEARQIAKAVADSPLVKTAIFGADPNWGRIVSAAGYAGVAFEENDLSLWLGDMLLYRNGIPEPFDRGQASAYLKNNREILLRMALATGQTRATFWTCDLGYEYVRLNAEYTT